MNDRLAKFAEERQLLLDRIVSNLEKDRRVVAAWLLPSKHIIADVKRSLK